MSASITMRQLKPEVVQERCTNICERVVYQVTGRMEEINVSKY